MNRGQASFSPGLILLVVARFMPAGAVAAGPAAEAAGPVPSYVGVYTRPPDTVGALDPAIRAYRIPDGPLLGNGDLAVAVGGTATEQTFYLSKSDLSQSTRGLGGLTFTFDGPAKDAGYRQEQDLYRAEVRSVVPLAGATIRMRSWTADGGNVLVTDLSTDGGEPTDVTLKLWSHASPFRTQAGAAEGLIWATREATIAMGTTRLPFVSKVAVATRVLGADPRCSTDGKGSSEARFTVPAGKSVRVVTAVGGGHDAADHVGQARGLAASLTDRGVDDLLAAHRGWWERYWSKSSVAIHDEPLEKLYYGALYVLGCSSREGAVAPGLAGPWHLNGPICWSNKYTLDYNFESVWWGVYSSNRPELALPYYDVILKLIPEGRRLAQEQGTKGVLFGVNAHAWGGFTDTRTLNMKGNAALAALNFIAHYQSTRDEKFLLDKAWPLLKEVAEFWEDNLVRDEARGRWVIRDSGAREGQKDENPITDLAYVKAIFRFLLDTSAVLEGNRSAGEVIRIGKDRAARWRSFVDELSPFPTIVFQGKTVFKEAENRTRMCLGGPGDNSDVLDHVFPGGAIGPGSDPELLRIARDTVAALNPAGGKASWFQANSFPKIYTQAVRSGYPPEVTMGALKAMLAGRQPYDDRGDHARLRDNLTIVPPVHSLEYVGVIEAIDSMLLQSHDLTIRAFPAWPRGRDAGFRDLRAYGAFLVSAELRGGSVDHVDITSEAGGTCTVDNPWPGKPVEVVDRLGDGLRVVEHRVSGDAIVFDTGKGRGYRIRSR